VLHQRASFVRVVYQVEARNRSVIEFYADRCLRANGKNIHNPAAPRELTGARHHGFGNVPMLDEVAGEVGRRGSRSWPKVEDAIAEVIDCWEGSEDCSGSDNQG
jgi:hypothetical protein